MKKKQNVIPSLPRNLFKMKTQFMRQDLHDINIIFYPYPNYKIIDLNVSFKFNDSC